MPCLGPARTRLLRRGSKAASVFPEPVPEVTTTFLVAALFGARDVTRDWALLEVSGVVGGSTESGAPPGGAIRPEVLRAWTHRLADLAQKGALGLQPVTFEIAQDEAQHHFRGAAGQPRPDWAWAVIAVMAAWTVGTTIAYARPDRRSRPARWGR